MQIGMIGLGRMGASMVRRLLKDKHECVVHDRQPTAVDSLVKGGATASSSLREMASTLAKPLVVWLMVPAAVVDQALGDLVPLLDAGDIVLDGRNSYYGDDMRCGTELQAVGIQYLDVGTSGGVAGLERGYCLMIGGDDGAFEQLRPIFSALAPVSCCNTDSRSSGQYGGCRRRLPALRSAGRRSLREDGAQRHRVRRDGSVRGRVEHLAPRQHRDERQHPAEHDAETTPLHDPALYQFEMNLLEIAEVWRRGSVIGSWLLDLTASALLKNPELASYSGRVSDSGEGRWTIRAAIDEGVPAPVLSAALYERFTSRGNADFANRILSAMRHEFGGHVEKPAP